MKEISVIIPTHSYKGRVKNLYALINSLLTESNLKYIKEIIVVDNGCSLPQENFSTDNLITKIVEEPIIGLNNARNCGIKNSDGRVCAFLDDDVIVSETWAKGIVEPYDVENVLCVGGSVILDISEDELPRWMSAYFSRFLFPPVFPETSGFLIAPYYLIGANMSFRRNIFDHFGMFDPGLDRRGKNLLSNGDTDFIIRLPSESIWYSEDAKVVGIIKTERFTRLFMVRRLFWQGISDHIMVKKSGISSFYDKDEIFVNKKFFSMFIFKLSRLKFFECFCILIRICGFLFGFVYIERK